MATSVLRSYKEPSLTSIHRRYGKPFATEGGFHAEVKSYELWHSYCDAQAATVRTSEAHRKKTSPNLPTSAHQRLDKTPSSLGYTYKFGPSGILSINGQLFTL